ncbi:hypothetical protein CDD82_6678 [Ophiocordyceps australis]|uniref:UBC core domain-containing protein n=1 Tax=Ophiocordyceps australis TaxID=1399860 RepID=A0A2C5YVZ1_9HYPO|nr:hypothetical protein CDD82_6678 [Ophiocordyceps australis]
MAPPASSTLCLEKLPSLRRQQLLSEFAGLRQAFPEGMFISLTPGDATLWSAVLFVRNGPYAQAVLRFQLSFSDAYPALPPLVLFSTDMFHPLITPLTTYTYTTGMQDNDTISARDEERLPPGGFSLRHGFPDWFGRHGIPPVASGRCSRQTSGDKAGSASPDQALHATSSTASPKSVSSRQSSRRGHQKPSVSAYQILRYIQSTFDSEQVLDSIPLEAAGNPGAWHAWRTHRRRSAKLHQDVLIDEQQRLAKTSGDSGRSSKSCHATPSRAARRPGEWNWEGVWEDRVKKGIAASLAEPVLYGGNGAPDELIKFLAMEDSEVASVKENLMRTLDSTA